MYTKQYTKQNMMIQTYQAHTHKSRCKKTMFELELLLDAQVYMAPRKTIQIENMQVQLEAPKLKNWQWTQTNISGKPQSGQYNSNSTAS